MATMDDLESWLIAIAEHTRRTREAVEGKTGGGPGNTPAARQQDAMFERLGRRIEIAMAGAVGSGYGQARALANRGFSGTVEQARFDYAMDQLARQMAAAMRPILDGMTYAAVQIERRMRTGGVGLQNAVMGGMVGAGAGYMLGGGPLGALGGAALGMGVFGENRGMGAAGGAMLGARLGPYGAAVGAMAGAVASSSDYGDLRRGGKSRVEAAFGALGMATFDAGFGAYRALGGTGTNPLDEARARFLATNPRPGAGAAERPREVTPFQAQMGDAGSTYFRIQEAMVRTTAGADFEDGGPFKPLIDLGLKILDQLIAMSGGTPPPRSAADGR